MRSKVETDFRGFNRLQVCTRDQDFFSLALTASQCFRITSAASSLTERTFTGGVVIVKGAGRALVDTLPVGAGTAGTGAGFEGGYVGITAVSVVAPE